MGEWMNELSESLFFCLTTSVTAFCSAQIAFGTRLRSAQDFVRQCRCVEKDGLGSAATNENGIGSAASTAAA